MNEKGNLSIHTENIFPIIKKFLYSDHDIFLRELVSNAVDASQKLSKLASIGDYKGDLGELKVKVEIDKKDKTITISDNGIGMTTDEIKKYINQIAFSGATEFVEKYKDKLDDKNQIIGHFGLGFYSAYMVAKKVDIVTLSHQEGAKAIKWECDGSTEFSITDSKRKERGTDVILHISEDAEEFLEENRISQILNKYSRFLPIPIYFGTEEITIKDKDGKDTDKKETKEKVINNPNPLWTKAPNDLKDEDYINFYKELYPFSEDPLFWIHLNVDYPFNLTGILYFPKIKNDFEQNKNKIQLYSRQVFITDEVKDIVPEFLQLLHGVIDSPDIPLNVSRSYLQSDGNVKKINAHITKKVADKLAELFKKDRKSFEEKWKDIGLFVKYGLISEEKFYDKAKEFALLKNMDDKYFTFDEYKKHIEPNQTDKDKNLVFLYTSDPGKQDAYIQSAKRKSYDVLAMDGVLDNHFINTLEQKLEKTNIKRVDSETADKLVDKDEKMEGVLNDKEKDTVKDLFKDISGGDGNNIKVESFSPDDLPVTIILPEFMRRMKDMSEVGGGMAMMGNMPDVHNIVINENHPVISKILKAKKKDTKDKLAKQAYDLGLLSQNMLSGSQLTDFINRSVKLVSE